MVFYINIGHFFYLESVFFFMKKRRTSRLVIRFVYMNDTKFTHSMRPCRQPFPWQPLWRKSEPAHSRTKGQSIRFTNRTGCNLESIHQRLHLNREITNHHLGCERLSQNNEYKSNRSHITLLKLCFSSSLISI